MIRKIDKDLRAKFKRLRLLSLLNPLEHLQ